MQWRAAILTVTSSGVQAELEDTSAQVIRELVEEEIHGEIVDYRIIPGNTEEIMAALIEVTEYFQPDLIFTCGGSGMGSHDVVPEATMRVIEREVRGLSEAMRYGVALKTRLAMLFRGISGIRGRTLIINLPGDPKGVHENFEAILDLLPAALAAIRAESM
ncbi:MAG TPA: MogA/MoaB family molybdenum cofactor biosynthesis protein [Bacilli bacterium]